MWWTSVKLTQPFMKTVSRFDVDRAREIVPFFVFLIYIYYLIFLFYLCSNIASCRLAMSYHFHDMNKIRCSKFVKSQFDARYFVFGNLIWWYNLIPFRYFNKNDMRHPNTNVSTQILKIHIHKHSLSYYIDMKPYCFTWLQPPPLSLFAFASFPLPMFVSRDVYR